MIIFIKVSFNEKILQDLVGTSHRCFQNPKSKDKISDKKLEYFTYEFNKATANFGKLYLLPKFIKGCQMFLEDL